MDRIGNSGMAITVAGNSSVTHAVLRGEIDLTSEVDLIYATAHLCTLTTRQVILDLTDVTFADTALLTFIVRVSLAMPPATPLTLYRAAPQVRQIVQLTKLDSIAALTEQLPITATAPDGEPHTSWTNIPAAAPPNSIRHSHTTSPIAPRRDISVNREPRMRVQAAASTVRLRHRSTYPKLARPAQQSTVENPASAGHADGDLPRYRRRRPGRLPAQRAFTAAARPPLTVTTVTTVTTVVVPRGGHTGAVWVIVEPSVFDCPPAGWRHAAGDHAGSAVITLTT